MKKLVAIVFITFSTVCVFGQNFEGKITYTNKYISKNPQMTDQQWTGMMGSTQEYYIKDGDYKSVMNGTIMQWQLYINRENKLYNKMSSSEVIYWNDGLSNPDSIFHVKLNKQAIKILGYKCDELILTCKSGIQKYYFNSSLKVDVSLFEKHQIGNWYDFLKESKSLPLKMIIDNQQFSLVSIATEVKDIELNAADFQLPENAQTQESPF